MTQAHSRDNRFRAGDCETQPNGNDPANPVIGIVQSFNTQMATQFSTFPLGSSSGGMTYVFDANGALQSIKVRAGITDGTTTEVKGDVKEGMKVIAGTVSATTTQTAQSSTPFNSATSQQQQRGARGGF